MLDDSWKLYAACRGKPTKWFYAEDKINYTLGRQVCARCSVRQACLDEAQRLYDDQGLWGGLSPKQRERKRRRMIREGRGPQHEGGEALCAEIDRHVPPRFAGPRIPDTVGGWTHGTST